MELDSSGGCLAAPAEAVIVAIGGGVGGGGGRGTARRAGDLPERQ
ncbi:hypothetical protein PVAP13_7KG329400 [Panicum virgatum]|uniref:Uncharacterized protein n=1 Tax=Panicum virgatum TaxID=38727 RepID=A0A8T0QLT0_PANVG|nr:hypothetical protein PVAP13_7KG329400 [Panicum virgatum]